MTDVIETLAAALDARKRKLAECPVRRVSFFDKPCPKCRATASGPCWLNVEADAALVDVVKELVAAQGMSTGTAKTPKAVEGRSPASPVGNADAPPNHIDPTLTMGESE